MSDEKSNDLVKVAKNGIWKVQGRSVCQTLGEAYIYAAVDILRMMMLTVRAMPFVLILAYSMLINARQLVYPIFCSAARLRRT